LIEKRILNILLQYFETFITSVTLTYSITYVVTFRKTMR